MINQIRPILVRFAVSAVTFPNPPVFQSDRLRVGPNRRRGLGAPSGGTLSFLDNAVDTTTGTILMKGRFENPDGVLWPGEFVNVTLKLYLENGAIVVPATAVVQSQNGTSVFTVNHKGTREQRIRARRACGRGHVDHRKGSDPWPNGSDRRTTQLTDGTKVQIKRD